MDIQKGESLSLASEILNGLKSDLGSNFNSSLNFGYDISCNVKSFLIREG